ncbi:MAG: NUDIX domain-containing protein [Clostridia bacterium]|nr:NUDIX domain-containing protein [Clostridia bacterium]
MITEKWDILDENGVPTGKHTLRGQTYLKNGEYHLVVHIWIMSPEGNFLIQRRSEKKRLMPGEWAATGGAAVSGEDSFTAANRELFEELGIKSEKANLKKLFRIKRRNSLLDVWFIETNIKVSELKLQKSEVAEAKWVSPEQLQKMIENNEFHNYGTEYFSKIFCEIKSIKEALA